MIKSSTSDMSGRRVVNGSSEFPFLKLVGLKDMEKGLDTPIFRYLPKDRFLELIESQANTLSHFSLWEDPFEAFVIRSDIELRFQSHDDAGVQKLYDFYKFIYGQSWTLKADESDFFWRAYGTRGNTVRIESTIWRLCQSLSRVAWGCREGTMLMGRVEYKADDEIRAMFSSNDFYRQITEGGNDLFETLFVKRKEFQDENELRIVASPEPDHIDKKKDTNGSLLKYEVEPSELIASVLLDPCMEKRKVEEVKCRVMHQCPNLCVNQSRLFEWPSGLASNQINLNEPTAHDFWRGFQTTYRNGQSEFSNLTIPNRKYWSFKIQSHLWYCVVFNRNCARAELYIDSPDRDWNKQVFDRIRGSGLRVSAQFGDLKWERLDERRGSRISIENTNLSFCRYEDWNTAIQWICQALDELRRVFPEDMLGDITRQ